jgi:PEGA domain
MKHRLSFFGVALVATLAAGCVERRFVVTTDPPGAKVLSNNLDLGIAPVDDHFIWHGKYHFTMIKDGYETLQVDQDISPKWYEYPGIDFISENIWPFKILDVRRFHYAMQPLATPNVKDVLDKAQQAQNKGKSIVPPPETPDDKTPASQANTPIP